MDKTMEEYPFAEVIKKETFPIEDIESEEFTLVDVDLIKTKVLQDEGQTWKKDLNSVELELANDGDLIESEIEEYEEKPNYDQLKKEIEDNVDSLAVVSSDCDENDTKAHCFIKQECDYDINEEFEVKNDMGYGGTFSSEDSSQCCTDTGLSEERMQNSVDYPKSDDVNAQNFDGLKRSGRNRSEPTGNKNDENGATNSTTLAKSNSCLKSQTKSRYLEVNVEKQINVMKCSFCEYSTNTKSLFDYHMNRIHLELKRYECPLCDYRTMLKICLKIHKEDIHPDKKKQTKRYANKRVTKRTKLYKCNLCDHFSQCKWTLRFHIDSVHMKLDKHRFYIDEVCSAQKKFKCSDCNYAAARKYDLQRHINKIHLPIEKKPIKPSLHNCNMCDYSTMRKRYLEIHIDTIHKGIKQYKCDVCDFSTARKVNLRYHKEIKHSNQTTDVKKEEIKCSLCDYSTTSRSRLYCHQRNIHLDQKKYECHMCDYSTMKTNNLKSHIDNIHYGKKQFKCDKCDFSTAYRGSLRNHRDSKHTDGVNEEINCSLCDFTARLKSRLDSHMRKVHLE